MHAFGYHSYSRFLPHIGTWAVEWDYDCAAECHAMAPELTEVPLAFLSSCRILATVRVRVRSRAQNCWALSMYMCKKVAERLGFQDYF